MLHALHVDLQQPQARKVEAIDCDKLHFVAARSAKRHPAEIIGAMVVEWWDPDRTGRTADCAAKGGNVAEPVEPKVGAQDIEDRALRLEGNDRTARLHKPRHG